MAPPIGKARGVPGEQTVRSLMINSHLHPEEIIKQLTLSLTEFILSQPSECEQCTCDSDGIARCLVADCAPPPCVNPVYEPGRCCPECKDGKLEEDCVKKHWKLLIDVTGLSRHHPETFILSSVYPLHAEGGADYTQHHPPKQSNTLTLLLLVSPGPNCYTDASRGQVIPAGEPAWVDSCTKCRCHDGQDAGYWEGNRLATCSRLKNCTPEQPAAQHNWSGPVGGRESAVFLKHIFLEGRSAANLPCLRRCWTLLRS